MVNETSDPLYPVLVKICIILVILFTGWLLWEHLLNRPKGYNEYSAANKAFEDKNYESAYKKYFKAYSINDKDVYVIEGMARSLMELKRYDEAIEYFYLAINTDSSFAPAYANLAVLYDRLENHEKAIELYEKAISLDYDLQKGMHWIDRILHGFAKKPSTIKDRLQYLKEQYLIREEDRILSVPEIDDKQPNYER